MRTLIILLAALLLGCSWSNPYYDPDKAHHTPEGFRNNYPFVEREMSLQWRWQQFWRTLPRPTESNARPNPLAADVEVLRANRNEPTLTWIGHATLLLQVGGVNVLTDPYFSERASPVSFAGLRRSAPPALALDELPPIDVVLISHNHYDHLDLSALTGLQTQPGGPPRIFVPLGIEPWLADEGIRNVVEQDWWESSEYLGLRIHLVPAQHDSARGWFDHNRTLWGGFVVEHPLLRFYFAGDTGYTRDFADIAERLGPVDLAALPIGGYEPRRFMEAMHMNPAEAVQAHRDLQARYSVAMHWGTFAMPDEPLGEPPKALAQALAESGVPPERFLVMRLGETRPLSPLLGKPTAPQAAASPRERSLARSVY